MNGVGLFGPLADDLLYVGVYGPGYGESIIVRVPKGDDDAKWIVIDGCLINRQSPAARILEHHEAEGADCLVLTHAHLDHAKGLMDVIELGGNGILACTDLTTPENRAVAKSRDGTGRQRTKVVQHLLTTIIETWDRQPERKWLMRRGETPRSLGAATLEVLHPDEDTVAQFSGQADEVNRLSTAIRLKWGQLTLVLGGDVITEDWVEFSRDCNTLNQHEFLKVPHHGSLGAQHDCFGNVAPKQPVWIVAPWSGRGGGLPKFVEDQGMDWLLARNPTLHLTGLPQKADLEGKRPYQVTAEDLRNGKRPPACGKELPQAGYLADLPNFTDVNSCWVTASFDLKGNLVSLDHGPGSVVVTRS